MLPIYPAGQDHCFRRTTSGLPQVSFLITTWLSPIICYLQLWHKLLNKFQIFCRRIRTTYLKSSITDFHIHYPRRTLSSYIANSGANVAAIQNALNQKDLRTTLKLYTKVARRAELEAREKANELMLSAVNNS